MSTTDLLRKQVHDLVSVADEKSLKIVNAILNKEPESDWASTLPPEIQSALDRALLESDNDDCITNEEVSGIYEQWLKK